MNTTPTASQIKTLRDLHTVPDDRRDDDWYVDFFDALPETEFVLSSKEPVKAPDGFYYFNVSLLPENGLPKTANVVSLDEEMLEDCLERCAGIVIYPDLPCKQDPVWILSYGELHSFYEFANFSGDPEDLEEIMDEDEENAAEQANDNASDDGAELSFTSPDDSFVHPGARRFMKSFFDALGLEGVKIAMMKDPSQTPSRALAFNLDDYDFKSSEELENALETVSWLLPPHRAIALAASIADTDDFAPLV